MQMHLFFMLILTYYKYTPHPEKKKTVRLLVTAQQRIKGITSSKDGTLFLGSSSPSVHFKLFRHCGINYSFKMGIQKREFQ